MTQSVPLHLIRERAQLVIGRPLWHTEQSVTPGGIRVTPCAELIPPDLLEVRGEIEDDDGDICPTCREHIPSA